jgi:hypothetical protein
MIKMDRKVPNKCKKSRKNTQILQLYMKKLWRNKCSKEYAQHLLTMCLSSSKCQDQ